MSVKQRFIRWWHILLDALTDDRYESHMPQGTASDRIGDHWRQVGYHLDAATRMSSSRTDETGQR